MKKLIKKTILLTTIFSMCLGCRVFAAYNQAEQTFGGSGKVLSSVNQGQNTLVNDDWGYSYLVNTNQWQEYQALLQQGSPEVVLVLVTDFDGEFYTIDSYQLAGQAEVNLPKSSCIKVTDKYNCDQLTVLKHIGNQLGTSYLYNQQKWFDDIDKKNAQIYSDIAKQEAKQQAEAKADQQQIDLNNQINAELNVYSENKAGQKTALKYSKDYLENYSKANLQNSNDKIWVSFDNERNYVQQWLNKTGLKTLKKLVDNSYVQGVTHYKDQELEAIQYFKDIESGKLPKNCSTSDWLRDVLKRSPMKGWNWLALWTTNVDFGLVPDASNTKWVTYQDSYNNNVEIKKMIEENLPTIASYANLTKEQKTQTVESLISGTFISPMGEKNSGIKTAAEFRQEILKKWNTEYLPNIKE